MREKCVKSSAHPISFPAGQGGMGVFFAKGIARSFCRMAGVQAFFSQRGLPDLFPAGRDKGFLLKGRCPSCLFAAGQEQKNGRAQRCTAAERSELMGNECVFGFFMPPRRGYACSFPACRSSSRARTRRGIRCGRAEHRRHWRLHPSSARWSSCAIRP